CSNWELLRVLAHPVLVPSCVGVFARGRDRRDLHSFPTRRSSDLRTGRGAWRGRGRDRGPPERGRRPGRRRRRGRRRGWPWRPSTDRKSTRLNSSHVAISYAVFCLKKKKHLRTVAPGTRVRAKRQI